MPATTTRGGFRYPVGADNSKNVRTDITNLANDVAAKVALYVESTAAARPAPGTPGRIHRATDTGVVTWDTGTGWDDVAVSRAGGSTITPSGNAVKGLVVKGAAGQTAALVEAQNNTGTVLLSVTERVTEFGSTGEVGTFISHITGRQQIVLKGATSAIGLQVRGASGQTANLAEFQDSAGAILARVSPTGEVVATVATPNGLLLRPLEAGAVDSAGPGFRTVRVAN